MLQCYLADNCSNSVQGMEKESLDLADIGLKLGPHYPLLGYLRAKQIAPKPQQGSEEQ